MREKVKEGESFLDWTIKKQLDIFLIKYFFENILIFD